MDSKLKVIKIITVSAVIFIFLLVISLIINLVKLSKSYARENELKAAIARYDEQIEKNENIIDVLESDDYVDKHAREDLNMKGRDEDVFTVK